MIAARQDTKKQTGAPAARLNVVTKHAERKEKINSVRKE